MRCKQIQCGPTLGSEDVLGSSPGSGTGLEYSPESKPWPSFALPAKERTMLRKHSDQYKTFFKVIIYNQTFLHRSPATLLNCSLCWWIKELQQIKTSHMKQKQALTTVEYTHTCVLKSWLASLGASSRILSMLDTYLFKQVREKRLFSVVHLTLSALKNIFL